MKGESSMHKKADKVFVNGKFFSVGLEGDICRSSAVAVKDGKFIYVGDEENVSEYIGSVTQKIDLQGKMVIPGMSDSHIHASWSGLLKKSIDLYKVMYNPEFTKEDYVDAYKKVIVESIVGDEAIIRGSGFYANYVQEDGKYATKEDLDEITRDKPIILRSFCYHYAWANSKALEIAGINKDTPDPYKGIIYRDENGEPTGFFQEMDAVDLLINNVPGYDLSVEEYKETHMDFSKNVANKYGLTMLFDALASENAIKAYDELSDAGELTMRVRGCVSTEPGLGATQLEDLNKPKVGKYFSQDTVKIFMDGTGIAFYLVDPYERAFVEPFGLPEGYKGIAVWDVDEMNEVFLKATELGYQIHVHCMGDGAVRQSLEGFEYVKEKLGYISDRNVIAHIMFMKEEDKKRMADLGVIAAVMPSWMAIEDFNQFYIEVGGEERAYARYPQKTLKNAGIVVTSGTDYPVSAPPDIPPNPFLGLERAITRSVDKDYYNYELYKNETLGPRDNVKAECFTLADEIQSLTINSAYQHGLDEICGSIEIGKSADFVVLSQNLEAIENTEISKTTVVSTYFEGELVYEA